MWCVYVYKCICVYTKWSTCRRHHVEEATEDKRKVDIEQTHVYTPSSCTHAQQNSLYTSIYPMMRRHTHMMLHTYCHVSFILHRTESWSITITTRTTRLYRDQQPNTSHTKKNTSRDTHCTTLHPETVYAKLRYRIYRYKPHIYIST